MTSHLDTAPQGGRTARAPAPAGPGNPAQTGSNSTGALLQPLELVLSTLNRDGSRRWLRPRVSAGNFWRARRIVAYVLIVVFTLIPYIRLNGKPLILLNLRAREFTLFGCTFLPTDTVLLALFLLAVVTTIFLLTALMGRVWCGWACPQTVYMEYLYRPIERLFDGPPGPKGAPGKKRNGKRTAAKYAVFLLASMYLAHTFLAYFVGVDSLVQWVRQSPFEHPGPFLVMCFVTAAMMFDFSIFREQTCIVACPYGRWQAALLDRDSMIVSYDRNRGEPRAKLRKPKNPAQAHCGLPVLQGRSATSARPIGAPPSAGTPDADLNSQRSGDCVDCSMCVDTCPTGIDIRSGLQMECIGCAQCIDACNSVMDKVGRPRGLIRYSSQARMDGQRMRFVRPRLVLYPAALIVILTALFYVAATRQHLDITVLRGLGLPFVMMSNGEIDNLARIKIVNRTDQTVRFQVALADETEGRLLTDRNPLEIGAGQTRTEAVHIIVPRSRFQGEYRDILLNVTDDHGFHKSITYRLLGPGPQGSTTQPDLSAKERP